MMIKYMKVEALDNGDKRVTELTDETLIFYTVSSRNTIEDYTKTWLDYMGYSCADDFLRARGLADKYTKVED